MRGEGPRAERDLAEGARHLVPFADVVGPVVAADPAHEQADEQGGGGRHPDHERRRGRAEQEAGDEGGEKGADVLHHAVGDVAGRELLRRLHQGRRQRRVRGAVAAGGDGEESREGEDHRGRGVKGGGRGWPQKRTAAVAAALASITDAPREAVDQEADQRRDDRRRQEADQGDDADARRPVRLEAVDAERDREAPGREGRAAGATPSRPMSRIGEIDDERAYGWSSRSSRCARSPAAT